MKIAKLRIDNFKRIKLIKLDIPKEAIAISVSGKNAQGKSSILDSFCAAFGGKRLCPTQPIKTGKKEALIEMTLNDGTIVKRVFYGDGDGVATSSFVEIIQEGKVKNSPQMWLDRCFNRICLDPLHFIHQKGTFRLKILNGLIGSEYIKKQNELKEIKSKISSTKKESEFLQKQMDMLEPTLPPLSENPLRSSDELVEEMRKITLLEKHLQEKKSEQETLKKELKAIGNRAKEIVEKHHKNSILLKSLEKNFQASPKIETLTSELAKIASQQQAKYIHASYEKSKKNIKESFEKTTRLLECAEKIKSKSAELSKQKLPHIMGISYIDGDIAQNGIMFDNLSQAQKINLTLQLSMAANPDLKIIYIKDGSLLDIGMRQLLIQESKANNFQLWLEEVNTPDQSDSTYTIRIEDGNILAPSDKDE